MTITNSLNEIWELAFETGHDGDLDAIGDDEDIIVFALNYLANNLDEVFDKEEDENPE